MKKFTYKLIPATALEFYKENGMTTSFDESLLNAQLIIEAKDEATADKYRMTCTDIRMWEQVQND
jgi:hypothetical protein